LKFDYFKFFESLSKKEKLILKKIFYYSAPPYQSNGPNNNQILRKKGYDSFISKVRKNKLIQVKEGRAQKIIKEDGSIDYSQKGVDTLMTLDMAFSKDKFPNVKRIILLTSDTDFCPVIEELSSFGVKTILYTYYERKRDSKFFLSQHLVKCCSKVRFLKKGDMVKFLF